MLYNSLIPMTWQRQEPPVAEQNDPRSDYNPQPYYQGQTPRPPGPGFVPPPGYYQYGSQEQVANPMGTSSFIIAIIASITLITCFIITGKNYTSPQSISPEDPLVMTLGCTILLALLAAMVGMGLGIAACMQQNRKKVLAIIGLCINSAITLGMGTLMIISMMMK